MLNKSVMLIPKRAKISYKRVLGGTGEHKRSGISIEETQKWIKISIETNDITALRATMNSIIRDIQVIENTAGTPAKSKPI